MGDINPIIAEARLDTLVRTLASLKNTESSSDIIKFIRKFDFTRSIHRMPVDDLLVLSEDWLDEWMSVMYPIVGRIGGRIRLPCKAVRRRYQHS